MSRRLNDGLGRVLASRMGERLNGVEWPYGLWVMQAGDVESKAGKGLAAEK